MPHKRDKVGMFPADGDWDSEATVKMYEMMNSKHTLEKNPNRAVACTYTSSDCIGVFFLLITWLSAIEFLQLSAADDRNHRWSHTSYDACIDDSA